MCALYSLSSVERPLREKRDNKNDEDEAEKVQEESERGKYDETMCWRSTGRNVGFCQNEAGSSTFYSIISFIVDKSKGGCLNDTDAYHLLMLIKNSNG